jgi:predicted DsbA family dithiol-disulfide isomerase
LQPVLERIEAQSAQDGLPFHPPTRMPNTRRALETAEVVRTMWPDAFEQLDDELFRAQFVTGTPLDDQDALDDLVTASGAPAHDVRDALNAGTGSALVDESMASAHEAGVTATPTWVVDERFLIPGVQPPETVQRWIRRLSARADDRR